jgi:RimJ/RimL family protein N-acetyltransferase
MGSTEQPLRVVEVRGPLRTERLSLRPFVLDDLGDTVRYESLDDVATCLHRLTRSPAEAASALAGKIGNSRLERSGDRLDLAIELPAGGDAPAGVIGEVSLELVDRHDRQGRLTCVVHPDSARNGYALEATTRVLDFAFAEVGLHRVVSRFDSRCAGAAALASRLGMRHEARLVHDLTVGERWTDTDIFAILDVEWAARKSIDGL